MISSQVAKNALPLVNNPDVYEPLQEIVDYLLERNRTALETMEEGPHLYRVQGQIALLRKFKALREEVIYRAKEIN